MGFGFPAAIGAQFRCPDDTVIAVAGDGGFQMTLCELATACIHRLPIKILVLDNKYLGMVKPMAESLFDNRLSGVDLDGNPDFVKLIEAYGGKGFRLRRTADIDKVLKQALDYNDGPTHSRRVRKRGQRVPHDSCGCRFVSEMLTEAPKHKLAQPKRST